MARRPVRGLTLVEVMVLIGILGLVLLVVVSMLPYKNASAQRATCMNNQKQLGLAMQQHEGKFREFPGWKNTLTRDDDSTLAVSWVLPILPNLERVDIYRNWRNPSISYSISEPKLAVYLRILTCPSDPPESTLSNSTPLAYSVNCGIGDSKPYNGVFFDQTVSSPATMSLDYLNRHDGSSYTLMLSENINFRDRHRWNVTDADVTIDRVGFRWDSGRINEEMDQDKPRPSSYHAGGVIATFCDGHVVFLREDISENVYQHLSTPDSAAAGVPGELKDEDY